MRSVIRLALLVSGAVGVLSQDDSTSHFKYRRQYEYGWPPAETVTETVTVHESSAPSTVTLSVQVPCTVIPRTSGLSTGTGSSPSSATSAPYGNGTLPTYSVPGTGSIPLSTGVSTAPQSSSTTSAIWGTGTGTGQYPLPPSSTGIYSNTSSSDPRSQSKSLPPGTAPTAPWGTGYPTAPWGTGRPPPPPSSTGVFTNTTTPLVWSTSGWSGIGTGYSASTSSPRPTVTPLNISSVAPTFQSSLPLTTGTGYPTGPYSHNGTRTWHPSSSSHTTNPAGSYSYSSHSVTFSTGGSSSSLPKPSSSVPYNNITSSTSPEYSTSLVSPYSSASYSTTSLPVASNSSAVTYSTFTQTVDSTLTSTYTNTATISPRVSSSVNATAVSSTDAVTYSTSIAPSTSVSSAEPTIPGPYTYSGLPLPSISKPSTGPATTHTPSFSTSVKTETASIPPAYTPPSYGQGGSSGGEGGGSPSGGESDPESSGEYGDGGHSSGSSGHHGESGHHGDEPGEGNRNHGGSSRGGEGKHRGHEGEERSRPWSYGSRYHAKIW